MEHTAIPSFKYVTQGTPFIQRCLIPRWIFCFFFWGAAVSGCASTAPNHLKNRPLTEQPYEVIQISERDQQQQAYHNFTMASIALTRGNSQEARKYLDAAIEADPDSAFLHQRMALLLKDLREFDLALDHARRAAELDATDVRSMTLVGDLYALSGNDDMAAEQYRKILDLDPDNQRIRLLLTTLLVRKKMLREALDQLDILIEKDPELVVAHYYRGRIHLELNRYVEAEKALKETLRLNGSLEPALFDMATLYQMTEREKDAVATYEKLLSLYPDSIPARERLVGLYLKLGLREKSEEQVKEIKKHSRPGAPERQALGLIYLRQGRLDDSIAELEMIVNAWPDDHKSRYYLATAYEEKGDAQKALDQYREIHSGSEYFINAQIHIAHLLTLEGDYDNAIKILQNALAIEQKRIDLYLVMASVYEAKEVYDKAIGAIREGLALDDRNVELLFRLGVLLDKTGSKDSCIQQMQRILEIDPNNADALNYIGYTYAEQGIKLDEAMELIQKALSIKPNSGYIIDSLGWVYYQKGDYDTAIQYLEKAAGLTGDDPTINEHLGDAYLKKQQYEKALTLYEKALSLKHPQEDRLREKITELQELLKKTN